MLGYHYDIVIVGKKYHDLMGPGIGHVLSPYKVGHPIQGWTPHPCIGRLLEETLIIGGTFLLYT